MSQEIRDGDLVQVIRRSPCCGGAEAIGHTFIARLVGGTHVRCRNCGKRTLGSSAGDGQGFYFPLARLKRIPPLKELEGKKTEEELTA